jgi:hypothetical protein
MMSPEDRLVYMANQIARNLAAQGEDAAVLAVADHIGAFWDPRMKATAARDGGDRSRSDRHARGGAAAHRRHACAAVGRDQLRRRLGCRLRRRRA